MLQLPSVSAHSDISSGPKNGTNYEAMSDVLLEVHLYTELKSAESSMLFLGISHLNVCATSKLQIENIRTYKYVSAYMGKCAYICRRSSGGLCLHTEFI